MTFCLKSLPGTCTHQPACIHDLQTQSSARMVSAMRLRRGILFIKRKFYDLKNRFVHPSPTIPRVISAGAPILSESMPALAVLPSVGWERASRK